MRCLMVLLLGSLPALAADPCVSGVPVGKRPGPYSFLVATGPERGQQTCFICAQEDKPAVVIFARSLSNPLGELLAKLDHEAITRKQTGFKAWMTLLADKADLDALSAWSQQQGLKTIPVGAFEDADGPPAYILAEDADVTVLLFVKEKVVANYAFRQKELTKPAIDEIMKTLPKLFVAGK